MPDADEYLIPRDLSSVKSCFLPFFIHLFCPQWIGVIWGLCVHGLIRKIPLTNQAKNELFSGLSHPSRRGMASLPTLQLHLHPDRGTIGPPEQQAAPR